jgi:hypothetical protein
MLILEYKIIELVEWEERVKECCGCNKDPKEPPTGDCCYDTWMEEYRDVTANFNEADRRVTGLTAELTYMISQRDMWKTWYDELTKVNDYSRKICHQLDIILHQIHRIGKNTHLTVKAIDTLYCMIRDFYMQLDYLKREYDKLLHCIKCLNNPSLAPNQGIRILIDDYGAKLDIVIATRDALIALVISAIDTANRINKNISHHFGLQTIIKEWKKEFHCEERCEDENAGGYRDQHGNTHKPGQKDEDEIEDAGLRPTLHFPICNSWYYRHVKERYAEDIIEVEEVNSILLQETKERDKYKAWKEGLEAVMKAVDPVSRCAPAK